VNIYEKVILKHLYENSYINQRTIASKCGYSLGVVNSSLQKLREKELLNTDYSLTTKALYMMQFSVPQNAIILAAGFGMRMVPINMTTPKALVEVNGEPLIERIIKQLNEVGVVDITVVVGFMKEQFEYLIDTFNVELVVNEEYSKKNNLHSLNKVSNKISNTYIIPCDIWSRENPFNKHELYSWYMISDNDDKNSSVKLNRKMELISVDTKQVGNQMIGIAYLSGENSEYVRNMLASYDAEKKYKNAFWEETLFRNGKMIVYGNMVSASNVVEINTYEQLRELDKNSNQLKSKAINLIAKALQVSTTDIIDITVLKKGMTNRSFMFNCKKKKYIMRIPGEGTEKLINRNEEAAVYNIINGKGICDDIAYIDPENGYKITEFLEGAKVCDSENEEDIKKCMHKLREFHNQKLEVSHEFNLFGQIEFYESLWNGNKSIYRDYAVTKDNVWKLRNYIEKNIDTKCLTHIDAVPDNFLFVQNGNQEEIRLIDWEYAGMQDPHVDIAMFCIYSMYNREQVDQLIDIYFEGNCSHNVKLKIYCYIAVCGLLWSNWCEYKRSLGIEFGEYSLRQYRYAKEYYKIVKDELGDTLRE